MKKEDRSCKNCKFGDQFTEWGKISVNKQVVEPKRVLWYCSIMIGDDRRHCNAPLQDFDPCHLWYAKQGNNGRDGGIDLSPQLLREEVF